MSEELTPSPLPPDLPATQPAPPQPQKPPAFSLPRWAWLIWAVGAALHGWIAWHGSGNGSSAFGIGYFVGTLVGTFCLPTFVAWLVWRASSRKGSGAAVAFVVVIGLMIFSQVGKLSDQAQRRKNLEQAARKSTAEMRATLQKGEKLTPEMKQKALAQVQNGLQEMANQGSPEERASTRAMQEFLAAIGGLQERYDRAAAKLDLDHFFEMETAADATARSARSAAIDEFAQVVQEMRLFFTQANDHLETELRKQGASPRTIRETLAGYNQSASARLPLLGKIRDQEEAMIQVMREYLDFAARYEGKWSRNPERKTLVLPSDEAVAEFNGFLQRVQTIDATTADLRKQVFSAAR